MGGEAETVRSPNQAEAAYLQGRLDALEAEVAALNAADEHRRAELEAARAEAADARAAEREWQGRLDESRRLVADLRQRLEQAEAAVRRASEERAAVIAALGRKARRRLGSDSSG